MARLSGYHLVDNTIIHSLLGRHEKVPVTVSLDLVLGLITVLRNVSIQNLPYEENLLCLYLNIGRLSLRPTQRLVNHDATVGQRPPLPRSAGPQQKRPHARRHPEAHGVDIARHVLHGIVNGHAGADAPPGRVDVERNVLGGVLVGEVEELGDEDVGDLVVDSLAEEDDAVLEEAGDDVLLGGAVVDDGHAYGSAGRLLVGILAAGVDLGLGFAGRRSHHPRGTTENSIVNAHDAPVLMCQWRSMTFRRRRHHRHGRRRRRRRRERREGGRVADGGR
mmetsp:Transcript_7092/g.10650  ORF Transcript_7092/g.10650 Transcript_7092/m.10650 type:complete len:277 (-) Transcript_7092:219-1049(-)